MSLTKEEVSKFQKVFDSCCDDSLDLQNIRNVLEKCGFYLPSWKVRKLKHELGTGELTKGIFIDLCRILKANDPSFAYKQYVPPKENRNQFGAGTSKASDTDTVDSKRGPEEAAFTAWINENLKDDPDLREELPIREGDLYEKTTDGIIFCKMVNLMSPDTIDERVINKKDLTVYSKLENLTLAVNSAQAIGCSVTNLNPCNLFKAVPYLVLGLLWQIIRVGLFDNINLEKCPGFANITDEDEHLNSFSRLSPKNILIKWVNYHLRKAKVSRRIQNFTFDITDSVVYTHLLYQIAPKDKCVTTNRVLLERNPEKRAELMLKEANKLGCRIFITPNDVVKAVAKLNLAFVANLFNKYPGLEQVAYVEHKETREEKTYRNWINSIGVTPYVKDLYKDLINGLVILQIFDHVQFGIVDWKLVHSNFSNIYYNTTHMLENANYCVRLGTEMNLSLVGITGWNISTGNIATLSLIWQLMRNYTLSSLSTNGRHISEEDILKWVNFGLSQENTLSKIKSFQDLGMDYASIILKVIDVEEPHKVNYELLKMDDALSIARYAISMARKIGAKVFALPEDIVDCNGKMIMTTFAGIMGRDNIEELFEKLK